MIAFARVQVRLLRAGGQRLTLSEAVGIVFAGNAVAAVLGLLPAIAVAVMIYRLISLWLLVVVGWIIYFVLRSRRARRAAAETPPASPAA